MALNSLIACSSNNSFHQQLQLHLGILLLCVCTNRSSSTTPCSSTTCRSCSPLHPGPALPAMPVPCSTFGSWFWIQSLTQLLCLFQFQLHFQHQPMHLPSSTSSPSRTIRTRSSNASNSGKKPYYNLYLTHYLMELQVVTQRSLSMKLYNVYQAWSPDSWCLQTFVDKKFRFPRDRVWIEQQLLVGMGRYHISADTPICRYRPLPICRYCQYRYCWKG